MTGPDVSVGIGGQVTHLANIQQGFSTIPNIDVDLYFTSKGLHNFESIPVKLLRTSISILKYIFSLWKYDVVHINTTLDNRCCVRDGVYGLLAILFRRPLFFQIHGGYIERVGLLKNSYINSLYGYILHHSTQVFVLTEGQSNSLQERYFIKAAIIRNYVHIPEGLVNCKVRTDKPSFLYLARIDREKGIFELIDACIELKRKEMNFNLNIAGEGPDLALLKQKVTDSGLHGNVKFYGQVGGAVKANLFQTSDVFVLPSYSEGLPYGVLEAISYAMPLIVTPVGAMPEIFKDGVEAIYVEQKDSNTLALCMEKFIGSNLIEIMSHSALEKSKEFSFKKMQQIFSAAWGQ